MIETSDLMYVTVRGRLHGQRVMNTFYYHPSADDPGAEEASQAAAFAVAWNVAHGNNYPTALSEELTDLTIRAQLVRPNPPGDPTRWAYAEVDMAVPEGQVASSSLPSTVTAVCRRRTALAGRENRGRIYVPGIPVTAEEDSQLTQAAYDDLTNSIGPILISPITSDGNEWTPVITNPPLHDHIIEVTLASFDPVLRVQRRRELNVGE